MPNLRRPATPAPTAPKVAFLTEKDATYCLSQLSSWQAGLCAVPLSTGSTQAEIEYFLNDSDAALIICSPKYTEMIRGIPGHPNVLEVTHEDLLGNKSA